MRAYYFNAAVGALLFTAQSLANYSLTQLQPIAGFSDACTQAYETPLTACTVSDFYEGATCSAQCIAFLEAMTKLLNEECKGITTFPNTLIGMFFQKTAVKKLCPNVDVAPIPAAGAGQGGKPSQAAETVDSTSTPSVVSVKVTLTTSRVIETTTTSSVALSTSSPSSLSTTTSSALVSSRSSFGPGLLGGTASPSASTRQASASAASSSSGNQATSTSASQGTSGGHNSGNGGTVLDAASSAVSGSQITNWIWSIIAGLAATAKMATATESTDITKLETELNTQRNQAFYSMVRMGHMNPGIANLLASVYRAALTCNTYIRQQAEHHEVDTVWLYLLYSAAGFVAFGVSEMGLSFGAKLMGMAKWFMLLPAMGIPVWKILERRGVGEIVDFFSERKGAKSGSRGDDVSGSREVNH
ncbi:MAG: hypothetical protein LQ338_005864 [Usnochroma carphineum]|nr:MAG: hypothetical protein LQ338_005864 [Usnochroma carphineum]